MSFSARAITLLVVCGISASASAQINITSANALARATAGDGSGNSQQASASTSGANVSAVKNFSNNGHVDAHTQWAFANSILNGSFDAHSFAQSQGQAGWADVSCTINFDAPTSLDVEYHGGFSLNSPGGSVNIVVRNRVTNAVVMGGTGFNFVHIAAGQYAVEVTGYLPYGDLSGSFELEFFPGNDLCAHSLSVHHGVYTGNSTHALADHASSCADTDMSPDIWYVYHANATGPLTITTCGSAFDTVLSVFNYPLCPPAGLGAEVACNDDALLAGCFRSSLVTVNVIPGELYFIRVAGYQNAYGAVQLNVGPLNDACENAQAITTGSTPFDNRLAETDGPALLTCSNNGNDPQVNGDLWYVYTAAQTGFLSMNTCGATFDSKLAVYSTSPCSGNPVAIACNDDSCGVQARIMNMPVTAGQSYFIRLGGYLLARGTGNLTLDFTPSCLADFNHDAVVNSQDFFDFLGAFFANAPAADVNGSGSINSQDYFDFLTSFFGGC